MHVKINLLLWSCHYDVPKFWWNQSWVHFLSSADKSEPIRLYSSDCKYEAACNAGDRGSIPGLGKSSGEGNGHSSILAWRIPWTEELGGLQAMGMQGVGHDWVTQHAHTWVCSEVGHASAPKPGDSTVEWPISTLWADGTGHLGWIPDVPEFIDGPCPGGAG